MDCNDAHYDKKNEGKRKNPKKRQQIETPEEREARLLRLRECRLRETADQREARLSYQRNYREKETLEQRKARLSYMRDYRQKETSEERESRLLYLKKYREAETYEEREARLLYMREYRLSETAEQRKSRLLYLKNYRQKRETGSLKGEECDNNVSRSEYKTTKSANQRRGRCKKILKEEEDIGQEQFNNKSSTILSQDLFTTKIEKNLSNHQAFQTENTESITIETICDDFELKPYKSTSLESLTPTSKPNKTLPTLALNMGRIIFDNDDAHQPEQVNDIFRRNTPPRVVIENNGLVKFEDVEACNYLISNGKNDDCNSVEFEKLSAQKGTDLFGDKKLTLNKVSVKCEEMIVTATGVTVVKEDAGDHGEITILDLPYVHESELSNYCSEDNLFCNEEQTNATNIYCKICNERFSNMDILLIHSETHADMITRIQNACNESSIGDRHLDMHLKKHAHDKSFDRGLEQSYISEKTEAKEIQL